MGVTPWVVAVGAGLALVGAALLGLRLAGARPGMARRLAGPREVRIGALLDGDVVPDRPVRVTGRIRCRDPLELGGGERAVAYHRDVEVRLARGGWRSIERLREARSFELWDHDGALTLDPAFAAEPLVSIPKVWRGDPAQLEDPHASAVARLAERHGPALAARSVTRTINVTDRLLVLAAVENSGRGVALRPPAGGYVFSTLPLDDAMRLLGGRHRRLAAASVVAVAAGALLFVVGLVGVAWTLVARV